MSDFGFIKVGACSPEVSVANPRANAEHALKTIRACAEQHVQILVLPELFLSGYTCADLFFQDILLEECETSLKWLLEKTKTLDLTFALGLPLRIGESLYNCAAVCKKGKIYGVVPKTHIPNSKEFYEKRWFASGKNCLKGTVTLCGEDVPFGKLLFNLNKNAVLGIEICEDMWAPVSPSTVMALNGANIILNLSASNEIVTKHQYRLDLAKGNSAANLCAYVFASSGVGESTTDLVFSGDCMICENGKVLAGGNRFNRGSGGVCACVDVQKLNAERIINTSFADSKAEYCRNEYEIISMPMEPLKEEYVDRTFERHPFIPQDKTDRAERCEDILSIQTAALATRMTRTGIQKFVIGISGGLDSTLALLVAARTADLLDLPRDNIICVTMPGFGTTDTTKSNAAELTQALGAQLRVIDITQACRQHFKDIGHDEQVLDVTYENVQARERTQILMDLSNKENALLIGTGDLSELALGWCTYNADHMSMYNVNCSIPKTLVRHLVDFVRMNSGKQEAEVLQRILDTPISPELLPPDKDGNILQKTEDKIGPYELHDFFLYHFIRFGTAPEKLLFLAQRAFGDAYHKDEIKKWLSVFIKRFFISQFKRSCVPDGPKVGSVSLSPRGDWRMPSDASFEEWLRRLS